MFFIVSFIWGGEPEIILTVSQTLTNSIIEVVHEPHDIHHNASDPTLNACARQLPQNKIGRTNMSLFIPTAYVD